MDTGVTFGITLENLAVIATAGFLRPVRVDSEHARQTDKIGLVVTQYGFGPGRA